MLDITGMCGHKMKNRVSIAKSQHKKKQSIQTHEPHLTLKSEGSRTGGKTGLKQDPKIWLRPSKGEVKRNRITLE